MLLSLPETHTCKSILLVRMATILFFMQIWYTNPNKLSGNDISLFSLPKYDLKAHF